MTELLALRHERDQLQLQINSSRSACISLLNSHYAYYLSSINLCSFVAYKLHITAEGRFVSSHFVIDEKIASNR